MNIKLPLATRFYALAYALGTFLLLYSLTNLYADTLNQHTSLPTVANFSPVDIPFIEWMILPYACSLPFFIAGFFIVQTHNQLQRLTHRLLLATLLACLCFYWFPLTFDTINYNVITALQNTDSKWVGIYKSAYHWAYKILHTLDKPFNQLPSLHVSYALLLMMTLWHSVTSKIGKFILTSLSLFIAISTLFVWQHHLLDVISGVVLAMMVLVFDRYFENKHSNLNKKNITKASVTKGSILKYLVIAVSGFLLIQILPVVIFPIGLWQKSMVLTITGYYWLLSFITLGLTYHWHKPALFHKGNAKINAKTNANKNGKHALISYLMFAPVMTLYRLMWWVASRMDLVQIPSENSIIKLNEGINNIDIIATGKLNSIAIKNIQPILLKYKHIIYLDLGCEIDSSFSMVNKTYSKNDITHHYIYTPMLDVTAWNLQEYDIILHYCQQLEATKIDIQPPFTNLTNEMNSTNESVLIVCQCVMGWSRSVAMLACILAYFGHSTENIYKYISRHYPKSHINGVLDDELLHELLHE